MEKYIIEIYDKIYNKIYKKIPCEVYYDFKKCIFYITNNDNIEIDSKIHIFHNFIKYYYNKNNIKYNIKFIFKFIFFIYNKKKVLTLNNILYIYNIMIYYFEMKMCSYYTTKTNKNFNNFVIYYDIFNKNFEFQAKEKIFLIKNLFLYYIKNITINNNIIIIDNYGYKYTPISYNNKKIQNILDSYIRFNNNRKI